MNCPQIGTVEQYLNNVRSVRVADRPTADQSCIVRLPSLAIPKMTARAVAREDSFTERVALLITEASTGFAGSLDKGLTFRK
jgi:hypothetical protein